MHARIGKYEVLPSLSLSHLRVDVESICVCVHNTFMHNHVHVHPGSMYVYTDNAWLKHSEITRDALKQPPKHRSPPPLHYSLVTTCKKEPQPKCHVNDQHSVPAQCCH